MIEVHGEDAQLQLAINGDSVALDRLISHHHPELLRFISRQLPQKLKNLLEPRDILQDTYIEVFRGIKSFRPDGPDAFFRWLATIARSRMVDSLRAAGAAKRRGQQLNPEDGAISDLLDQLVQYKRTPSQSAAAHELFAVVDRSIELLPEEYRHILRLRHDQGLSPPQAAEQMNRTVGAAQMMYNRALKALSEKMRSISLYQ